MARKASKGTFIEFVSYCYFCICDLLKSEDWPWCHMSEWLMVFWYTLHDMMMRWYEWCFYRKVDLAMSLFTAQKAQSRSTEFPPQLMTGFWGGMTTLLEWLLYFFFKRIWIFFHVLCWRSQVFDRFPGQSGRVAWCCMASNRQNLPIKAAELRLLSMAKKGVLKLGVWDLNWKW